MEAVRVEARNIELSYGTTKVLRDISLSVRAGQVIGIAGVAGNGQGEFFESLSGEALQADAATVRIRDTDAGRLTITGRRLLGAGFVPEERLGHGAGGGDKPSRGRGGRDRGRVGRVTVRCERERAGAAPPHVHGRSGDRNAPGGQRAGLIE